MSADKYAQFIAEQQKKLSVSGVNAVEVTEKKELSPKQKKIAAMAGDKDEIEGEDFAKLRAMKKEEVEQIDELKSQTVKNYKRAAKKQDNAARDEITYGMRQGDKPDLVLKKLRFRRSRGLDMANKKLKGGAKVMATEEVEFISIEEQAYLEEMVGKGKLPSILQHHKDNMNHHYKMMDHHSMMADKSEAVGDTRGFDHHTEQGMGHEMEMRHHMARYDHAASLGMKAKALKQVKAAKAQMDGANKALELAKLDKREY